MNRVARKFQYLTEGLIGRHQAPPACPACADSNGAKVDCKFFHDFIRCETCSLMYRWPGDSEKQKSEFYQESYFEAGLTTELPSEGLLAQLKDSNFLGTEKDFSRVYNLFQELGVSPPARILDFGANWGYYTFQMLKLGYQAEAYEISKPRALFGKKLDIDVQTNLSELRPDFDHVYSSHVLEHVHNPLRTLGDMFALVKKGGLIIGHTPNGSLPRQALDPKGYRKNWGRVHPVLLTAGFIEFAAAGKPVAIASRHDEKFFGEWDQTHTRIGELEGPELVFAIKCN